MRIFHSFIMDSQEQRGESEEMSILNSYKQEIDWYIYGNKHGLLTKNKEWLGEVAHSHNPSTWEVEARGSEIQGQH